MKLLTWICVAALLSVLCSVSFAQQWEWQSPLPQGNSLEQVEMFDGGNGYAVSNLTSLLRTSDYGESWDLLRIPGDLWIAGMSFLNMQEGWIAGTRPTFYSPAGEVIVLHTQNGGITWSESIIGDSLIANDIVFLNASTGFVAGRNSDYTRAYIARTTDGGEHWSVTEFDTIATIESLDFLDAQHGWAIGRYVLYTSDGGASWETISEEYTPLNKVRFFDELNGIGLDYSDFLKTTDGGVTWTTARLPNSFFALGMEFSDPQTGWIAGSDGSVLKTTNGGDSWQIFSSGINTYLNDVAIADDNSVIVVSTVGHIARSTDSGAQWTMQAGQRVTERNIYAVDFCDSLNGWAVGGRYDGGRVIVRTTDGGETWLTIEDRPDSTSIWDVAAINPQTAWIAGWYAGLQYTTDGGLSWNPVTLPQNLRPSSLHFLNPDSAWLQCGGRLVYTINGGRDWTLIPTNLPYERTGGIFFLDMQNGWCYGGKPAMIYHTTDGGVSWNEQYMEDYFGETVVQDVHFTNSQTGWAAVWSGSLLHTTDGGENWIELPIQPGYGDWVTMSWPDADHGFIISDYEPVVYTTDGGETWQRMVMPFATRQIDCDFIDATHGWVVGWDGNIVKWNGNTLPVSPHPPSVVPLRCSLSAYPNPFNPTTTFEYSIPVAGPATVAVYNLTGQLVETLADRVFAAGEYRTTFNGSRLPSGIYFARLQGSNFSTTHKLVLLK